MATLDDTVTALIQREGGHANDPADRGGETMYGITVAVARAFGYRGPMAEMPRGTAAKIYRERYWFQPGFDQVNAIAPAIAEEMLDTGVNMGTGVAGKFLQRALNVLNQGGKVYPDLTPDGAVGRMTLYALTSFIDFRGLVGRAELLEMLRAQQSVRYIEIAEANPTQERFSWGWQLNRV